MKRCPQCGRGYSDIVTVCPECNIAITTPQKEVHAAQNTQIPARQNKPLEILGKANKTSQYTDKEKKWLRWAGIVLALAGLLLAFVVDVTMGSLVAVLGVGAAQSYGKKTDKIIVWIVAVIVWVFGVGPSFLINESPGAFQM